MSATCPHCGQAFHTTRGLFGQEAVTLRDAHARGCRENPRNKCFCGRVFPDSAARDNHATRCEMNPVNNFKCPYCPQEFVTTYGWLASDGRTLRDTHAVGCKLNPANTCHCGQLFPNPDFRNAHAVKCQMNPANCFKCRFCSAPFITTFNMFGFRSQDGLATRDMHEVVCERNPKNICYCGQVFPNQIAKEKHAATCEENPANRFECPHCDRLFITRFGMMGMVVSDGRRLRDAHERGCEKNVANACFCGQLFSNPEARDAHAVKCNMNPVNRFSCGYCRKVFVTNFGMFRTCGSVERDAHQLLCSQNPANATCSFCKLTFTDSGGFLDHFRGDARRRCQAHSSSCSQNPRNCFSCGSCGRCFTTRRRWLRHLDGKVARDEHQTACDVIPCDFEVKSAEVSEWHLVASPDATASGKTRTTNLDSDVEDEPSVAASSVNSGGGEDEASEQDLCSDDEGSSDSDEARGSETEGGSALSVDSAASEREEQPVMARGVSPDADDDVEEDGDNFHDAESACGDETAGASIDSPPVCAEKLAGCEEDIASTLSPSSSKNGESITMTSLAASSVEESLAKVWEQEAFEVL